MGMQLSIDEYWETEDFKGWKKKDIIKEAKKDIAEMHRFYGGKQRRINRLEDTMKRVLELKKEENVDITEVMTLLESVLKEKE